MSDTDIGHLDHRLQETEIRLAFLEKELNEYKDAAHTMHDRIIRLETTLAAVVRKIQRAGGVTAESGESDES